MKTKLFLVGLLLVAFGGYFLSDRSDAAPQLVEILQKQAAERKVFLQKLSKERKEVQERQTQERKSLIERHRDERKDFQSQKHTVEERKAFFTRQRAQMQELRVKHRSEMNAKKEVWKKKRLGFREKQRKEREQYSKKSGTKVLNQPKDVESEAIEKELDLD